MKVLGIYADNYPWDIRIEKILGGLAADGHSVNLVCRNLHQRPHLESVAGICCRRVLRPVVPKGLQSALSIPAFFNPIWSIALRRAIREIRPSVLIARDLPLAMLAIKEGRRVGIPCIIDMAENHPEMWRQVGLNDRWLVPSFLFKNVYVAKHLERKVAKEADAILVVIEEMRDHLISIGAQPEKVVVASNTPMITQVADNRSERASTRDIDTLNIIYTGYVTNRRGLEQVIKAVALLVDMRPEPRFHIVGDGNYLESLRRLADSLGVASRVVFHGWVDHSQLPGIIASCDVGIVPHPKNGHTDCTIPNKIFDYMAMGLPVLVSNARPLARIVEENRCGSVFAFENTMELAERIREYADPKRRETQGERGRIAINTRYHWEIDYRAAVHTINRVIAGGSPLGN